MGRGTGKRVLVVMELGSNWGHLLRMRPVVQALRAQGFEVTVAATDLPAAQAFWHSEGIPAVQCPGASLKQRSGPRPRIDCYAQILERLVFGNDVELLVTLKQWEALLAVERPDVLLADFAPIAGLIAHLHRLPLVRFNSGWEVPIFDGCLSIVRRPSSDVARAAVEALEANLVRRLNRACDAYGAPSLENLGSLLAVGTQLLSTWPELDHFAPRPSASYIGPIFSDAYGDQVDWPASGRSRGLGSGKRVLLYLARDDRNVAIIAALRRLDATVVAVLPKLLPQAVSRISGDNWVVRDKAVRLSSLLSQADLIINNGGHGLLAAGLLAGVPLLILPTTLEQELITRVVAGTGAAWSLSANDGVRRGEERIATMLHDPEPRHAASRLANKYRDFNQSQALSRVIDAVGTAVGVYGA